MITWVSLRSGRASRGMFRMVQKDRAISSAEAAMISQRFSAEKRMTRWRKVGCSGS